MQTIMFSQARNELSGLLDQIARDHVAVEIVRCDKPSAIVMDKSEYEGMMETIHLLSSPVNAARLLNAIAEVKAGNFEVHDLIEE